jgi:hypothetical protein
MSTYWQIYCVDEGGWQYEWADEAPSVCPNNPTHEVRSTVELYSSTALVRIPIYKTSTSITRTRLKNFIYAVGDIPIRTAKAIAYKSGTMTSFTISIFDATHLTFLASTTFTNTDETQLLDLGTLSNVPISDSILEINVSMSNGDSSSIVYVDELIFYS